MRGNLLYSYQRWRLMHMMGAQIYQIVFVLSLQKYGERKSLGFLMDSVNFNHDFLKSTGILLADDHCGPSTWSFHSRCLKIEPHCAVRSQRKGRERKGSVVTKVVDSEGLLIQSRSFHPGERIFQKVMLLSLWHSKSDCLMSISITSLDIYFKHILYRRIFATRIFNYIKSIRYF